MSTPKKSIHILRFWPRLVGVILGVIAIIYTIGLARKVNLISDIEGRGGYVNLSRDNPMSLKGKWGKRISQAFTTVTVVGLVKTSTTDDELKKLNRFPKLRWLYLHGNPITDEGIKTIGEMNGLEMLDLGNTSITDEGLFHLRNLKLDYLGLSRNKISDAGVSHLKIMVTLQRLELSDTGVSDDAIPHLSGLKYLNRLDISNTKITSAGIARLKKSLSRCQINH